MGAGAYANTFEPRPTPGMIGSGLGGSTMMANFNKPIRPTESVQALKAMTPSMGKSLQPGEAPMAPAGQTPYNPWGSGRGGSGLLPIYRRPGTMPG